MTHHSKLVLVQTRLPKKLAAKLKKEVKDRNLVSQAALVRRIIADYYEEPDATEE